jgi:hypothetical protein
MVFPVFDVVFSVLVVEATAEGGFKPLNLGWWGEKLLSLLLTVHKFYNLVTLKQFYQVDWAGCLPVAKW